MPKDLAKEEKIFNELLEFKGHNIFLQTAVSELSRAIRRTRDFALIKPFTLCVLAFTFSLQIVIFEFEQYEGTHIHTRFGAIPRTWLRNED